MNNEKIENLAEKTNQDWKQTKTNRGPRYFALTGADLEE